jgi:hypothetical protein
MWLEYLVNKSTSFENTEGAIKNVQSRDIGNIGYKRQRQTKHKPLLSFHSKSWTYNLIYLIIKDQPNFISISFIMDLTA